MHWYWCRHVFASVCVCVCLSSSCSLRIFLSSISVVERNMSLQRRQLMTNSYDEKGDKTHTKSIFYSKWLWVHFVLVQMLCVCIEQWIYIPRHAHTTNPIFLRGKVVDGFLSLSFCTYSLHQERERERNRERYKERETRTLQQAYHFIVWWYLWSLACTLCLICNIQQKTYTQRARARERGKKHAPHYIMTTTTTTSSCCCCYCRRPP